MNACVPVLEVRREGGGMCVYAEGQLLAEFRQNRFLRFRATPRDEQWIGAEAGPADLGWAFSDELAKGLEVLGATYDIHPESGTFCLRVCAQKPQFASDIRLAFTGTWMPEVGKFKYRLATSLDCALEDWYLHSTWAQASFARDPTQYAPIEPFDYRIEAISAPERYRARHHEGPQLYAWFVKSYDGRRWEKWPKVYIPYPTRPGHYITIHENDRPIPAGGCYGFLDAAHGGWITRVEKTSIPIGFEICWMLFDVHAMMFNAVPPRYSAERLSLHLELAFEPIGPAAAGVLLGGATELDWRGSPDYQLPLFSRRNRFDVLLTDLPGEKTGETYIWWASSADCFRDNTTGVDDAYSASIRRQNASAMPAAWSTSTWGFPFEARAHDNRNRRFRLRAMVKTLDCAGPVRLGFACAAGDIFYGENTHTSDGSPLTARIPAGVLGDLRIPSVNPKPEAIAWQFSRALSGTHDWTPLTLEFTVTETVNLLILEQHGNGQSWFDNVEIEELA